MIKINQFKQNNEQIYIIIRDFKSIWLAAIWTHNCPHIAHIMQLHMLFVQSQPNTHKNNVSGFYTLFRWFPQKSKTGALMYHLTYSRWKGLNPIPM
jgi:hypothetical protein